MGFAFVEKLVPEHQGDADEDGRVSDIERRPMVAGNMKIKKIDHCIKAKPVDHIAQRTL